MVQTAIRGRILVIAVLLSVLSLAGLARPAQAADYRYQVVGSPLLASFPDSVKGAS